MNHFVLLILALLFRVKVRRGRGSIDSLLSLESVLNKLKAIKTFMDMDAVEHVNGTTTTIQHKEKIQFIVEM